MFFLQRIDFRIVQLIFVGTCAVISVAFPQSALLLTLVVASIVVTERLFIQKKAFATPADLGLLFLSVSVLVNPLLSVRQTVSLPMAMQTILNIMLLVSLAEWAKLAEIRLRWSAVGLALVGMSLVVIAPFTVDWITDKFGAIPAGFYAVVSSLSRRIIHPNILAGAIAVLLVTLATYSFWMWSSLRLFERILFLLSLVSMMLLLIFTQSRGAMFGVVLGFVVMVLIAIPRRWQGVLVIFSLLAALALFEILGINLDSIVDSSATVRGAVGRVEIWSNAYLIVTDFPFTGIGLGNFSAVSDLFYPFLLAGEGQPHAHNLFLQIALDIGLFGLAAWLACLAVVLVCCVQVMRVARNSQNSPLIVGISAGLFCGQLAMLVHGITDAPLWATRPALLVWVLWGLALALPELTELQRSESDALSAHYSGPRNLDNQNSGNKVLNYPAQTV